jgi:hypothetical protein
MSSVGKPLFGFIRHLSTENGYYLQIGWHAIPNPVESPRPTIYKSPSKIADVCQKYARRNNLWKYRPRPDLDG